MRLDMHLSTDEKGLIQDIGEMQKV